MGQGRRVAGGAAAGGGIPLGTPRTWGRFQRPGGRHSKPLDASQLDVERARVRPEARECGDVIFPAVALLGGARREEVSCQQARDEAFLPCASKRRPLAAVHDDAGGAVQGQGAPGGAKLADGLPRIRSDRPAGHGGQRVSGPPPAARKCAWTEEVQQEARGWAGQVAEQWQRVAVESHAKKAVDDIEGADVQGAYIHPSRHMRVCWGAPCCGWRRCIGRGDAYMCRPTLRSVPGPRGCCRPGATEEAVAGRERHQGADVVRVVAPFR